MFVESLDKKMCTFADVIQSISNMVTEVNSKNQLVERNFKRNEMLAEYFFGLSKMVPRKK